MNSGFKNDLIEIRKRRLRNRARQKTKKQKFHLVRPPWLKR